MFIISPWSIVSYHLVSCCSIVPHYIMICHLVICQDEIWQQIWLPKNLKLLHVKCWEKYCSNIAQNRKRATFLEYEENSINKGRQKSWKKLKIYEGLINVNILPNEKGSFSILFLPWYSKSISCMNEQMNEKMHSVISSHDYAPLLHWNWLLRVSRNPHVAKSNEHLYEHLPFSVNI